MNIAEVLRARARERGGPPAIIDTFGGRRRVTTFAALDEQADRGASSLIRNGIRPGDGVLLFQPMSAELYVALVAVFRAGAVAMFLDPSAGSEHIARCCEMNPPRGLIASPKAHLLRFASGALRRIPHKFSLGVRLPGALPWPGTVVTAIPDVLGKDALITFTSGSTGLPKAALRTHAFLMAQHRVLERTLGLADGAIDMATLPVFVLANLASGVTSVIPDVDLRRPGEIDGRAVTHQIAREQVSSTAASPAFLERVVAVCESSGRRLDSLRKVFVGGAPVFPPFLDRLRALAPNARITSVYGSTEAEPICELQSDDIGAQDLVSMHEGRGLLAGRPVAEIALRVMKEQWGSPVGPFTAESFEQRCVQLGAPGEIVVSGPHVLTGYLNGRGDEETKFRVDGAVWHRTGDCGYLDNGGRVWMLGRSAARITDERGVLYPFSVECALSFLPEVRRSAMVSGSGRRILFVEWHSGSGDERAIREHTAWASIDEIHSCRKIPVDRRHNAKIDYIALERIVKRRASVRALRG
jgi:acyl-CoA synthetase (AMP-forming)/AMP-acid ligase II